MGDEKRGLYGRMAVALAAVLALNLLAVGLLVALAVPWLAAAARAVGVTPGWRAWLAVGGASAVVGAGVAAWLQLRYAHRRVLSAVDGVRATDETHPDLVERVRRLSALADVPEPDVVVADDDAPNSFTVGASDAATIVVTEGLLAELGGDELDAVLAHELAHVLNRDAAVMTLVALLPSLVTGENALASRARSAVGAGFVVFVLVSLALAWTVVGATALGAVLAVVVAGVLGSLIVGAVVAPVLVLGYRLSWDRELVADRAAARLTGQPAALAAAIDRLAGDTTRPETDARLGGDGIRPLCIVPFDPAESGLATGGVTLDVPTHPPAERRREHLRSVTMDMER